MVAVNLGLKMVEPIPPKIAVETRVDDGRPIPTPGGAQSGHIHT
jgi:hypothetical protein